MERILECVPNYSEGKDIRIIKALCESIEVVAEVRVLHVDSGEAANRTVITFAGSPEAVCEAAFNSVKCASMLIDMRKHKGVHPRFGSVDVLPLIPVAGISMEEAVFLSRKLAKRIGDELNIPVYCYAESALAPYKQGLEMCRAGEYEGLFEKMKKPEWKPDYGNYNAITGAIACGARNFLIAYNINLNTTSVEIAKEIAYEIRESGKPSKNQNKRQGKLKYLKAIGWYIEEFNKVQVSMNLTNIIHTPIHIVYEEVVKSTIQHGVQVTGSELIGLIPKEAILNAGKYFACSKGKKSLKEELDYINLAIDAMGLNELYEFKPEEKILEFQLHKKLISQSV